MNYPTIGDYYTVIRHPKIAFRKKDPETKIESDLDPLLVNGKPIEKSDFMGSKSLWIGSGAFACVFKYETYSPRRLWAIRCFTKKITNIESHYKKISRQLNLIQYRKYFLDFKFINEGIKIKGIIYPIIRMEWFEGKNLRSFIKENLSNKNQLMSLANSWKQLSIDLFEARIAHGDLQHNNILINSDDGINIKLIDYDSLYFLSEGDNVDDVIKGIDGYQHSLRETTSKKCLETDYFSQLVIYISIVAIAENSELWNLYELDKTERLLFSKDDLLAPKNAKIFNELAQASTYVSNLSKQFQKICSETDIRKIPPLHSVINEAEPIIDITALLVEQSNLRKKIKTKNEKFYASSGEQSTKNTDSDQSNLKEANTISNEEILPKSTIFEVSNPTPPPNVPNTKPPASDISAPNGGGLSKKNSRLWFIVLALTSAIVSVYFGIFGILFFTSLCIGYGLFSWLKSIDKNKK